MKIYEKPNVILLMQDAEDIITTSAGDTPEVNPFDW